MTQIVRQSWPHYVLYGMFGAASLGLLLYYLSGSIVYFTSSHQFPVNSFRELPLTLLIFPAEVFSLLFAAYFMYTLLTDRPVQPMFGVLSNKAKTPVAILLPIYNEPREIVERTLAAVLGVRWQGKVTVYVCDDSSTDEHRRDIEELVRLYGGPLRRRENGLFVEAGRIRIVRRKDREGYKAGNINSAIRDHVREPYFVIFDSDQAPAKNFLEETMDFFVDPSAGFVQTPQYFINDATPIERAAKIGANIFYHSQTMSKARDGAMPFCGTNVVVRREAFMAVRGFCYYTATEDIDLGIRMNDAGYRGLYVPQVLAKGYAPKDFKSFASQQYRWANGNLGVLREHWRSILFSKRMSLRYQVHTFFTLGWWLIGVVSFVFVMAPVISLLTGLGTHHTWLPSVLIVLLFLNVVWGVTMIYVALHGRMPSEKVRFSDALLQYSLVTNCMFIYMSAAVNALLRRYVGFVRTDKNGKYVGLRPIRWNLLLGAVCFGLSLYALYYGVLAQDQVAFRKFLPVSLWLLFYSVVLVSSLFFVRVRRHQGQVTSGKA